MYRGGVKSVSYSSSYTINNAVDYPLLGLNLYGKSVQDGVPSPDNPVDIVSIGDSGNLDITAKNGSTSVTASVTTALPLYGIPVSEGGNYTDSNGQQWVCDELIYNADGTGKVVKRIAALTINDNTRANFMANSGSYQRATIPCAVEDGGNVIAPKDDVAICSAYKYDTGFRFTPASLSIDDYAGCFAPVNGGAHNINIRFATKATTSEQFISENLGVKVIYQRETPKEIELTAAEMSALSQLQTYSGVTNIFNSGGTDMDVKFCTNKMLSECAAPITTGLQKQIDELKAAVLSLGGNI